MAWYFWPTVFENAAAKLIEFALEGDLKTRPLQTEIETTDSAEKRSGAKRWHRCSLLVLTRFRRSSIEIFSDA